MVESEVKDRVEHRVGDLADPRRDRERAVRRADRDLQPAPALQHREPGRDRRGDARSHARDERHHTLSHGKLLLRDGREGLQVALFDRIRDVVPRLKRRKALHDRPEAGHVLERDER